MTPTTPLSGIDLLITRGPNIDAVSGAVEAIAGIERGAIKWPEEPEDIILAKLDHGAWAAIDAYSAGDFGFKVALYGRTPRDYHAIARALARQLNVLVAWPDERTLSVTAFIACEPDGADFDAICDDDELDGLTLRRLTVKSARSDVDNVVANALWLQSHNASTRSELLVRALNNELDFDLRAIDDAILDAVRELGERGIPMTHADLYVDLRRYYPPVVRTLLRRALGRPVAAPDLRFEELALAIWKAIPRDYKIETGH